MSEQISEQEIKAAVAAYHREWRKRNKERVKQINARYWAKRAEKLKAEKAGEVGQDVATATDNDHDR